MGAPDQTDETDETDLAVLGVVTARLVAALDGIEGADHGRPTPCGEWDLADLVDHVTGGNWFTIDVLGGETADGAMAATMARFAAGSVSAATAARSAGDQLDAFSGTGVLDRTWPHVAGQIPGRAMLRLRLHDLIVHTWDIDETLRSPAEVPAELAAWGLRELADPHSLTAAHFETPGLADHTGARVGQEHYLAVFGRRSRPGTDPT